MHVHFNAGGTADLIIRPETGNCLGAFSYANRVVSVLIVGQTMDWHRLKLYVDAVVFRRYEEEKS